MTDDELTRAIHECEQKRARLIRVDMKVTAEYRVNNETEDRLLDELFRLRFPRVGSIADAND